MEIDVCLSWKGYKGLLRPLVLAEGSEYIAWDAGLGGLGRGMKRVKFHGYTACPAVVVVVDAQGNRQRCARDALFLLGT